MNTFFALLPRGCRRVPRPRARNRFCPADERLETRNLPSYPVVLGALDLRSEAEPNDTLDLALVLGDLNATPVVVADGTIGNGSAGAADVDWYRFQIDRPAHVQLHATGQPSDDRPAVVLSLYHSDPDDFGDLYTPLRHRLLAQVDGGPGGEACLARDLGPGTYYAALSGSGNRSFHPFLADSGLEGSTGAYRLQVMAADLNQDAEGGPIVLAVDRDAAPESSPFVIRVAFSSPNAVGLGAALETASIDLGTTVRLLYNANGTFGDGADHDVSLGGYNFTQGAQELQLFPTAPLRPGWYQLVLAGDSGTGHPVLTDPAGVPLGKDADHPDGQDYTYTFKVGSEADDTAARADDLGELPPGHLVQVDGAIGDDSFYDPTNPEVYVNPAWDVDLYHFHVSGPGRHALIAEVFASRFGSPLDPGVSLFVLDPTTGQLRFLDGNNNTRNPEPATNGFVPLYTDPALFVGLTEGDYFVAVANGFNTPAPEEGLEPGSNGIFDPNVSHSGQAGSSTGLYVLNLLIQPDDTPPQVTGTNPAAGATLEAPPTELLVRFNEPMNLRRLSFLAYEQTTQETVAAVFVEGADGTASFPRLVSYDEATNEARFLLLDGLANGAYRLHLSGPLGLTDRAGNPLVGTDPGGDYLVPFTVAGPPRGTGGDPRYWTSQEPHDDLTRPQDLGILFPHEFRAEITVRRDTAPAGVDGPRDTADVYRFQVIQDRTYGFTLSGPELPGEVILTLTDAAGDAVPSSRSDNGRAITALLNPGTYVLHVGQWSAEQAAQVAYRLQLKLFDTPDNPPPPVKGPRPPVRPPGVPPPPNPGPVEPIVPPSGPGKTDPLTSDGEDPPAPIVLPSGPGETGPPNSVGDGALAGEAPSPNLGTAEPIVQPAPRVTGPPTSAADGPPVFTPAVTSTAAPASGARAGPRLPEGTLVELAFGPLDGTSGTNRPYAPLLAEHPAVQVTGLPRLVVAVAEQLPFLTSPLISGGEGARAEPAPAHASPPALGRKLEEVVPWPGPSPEPIPDALPAVPPREQAPRTPPDEQSSSPASRPSVGKRGQDGTPRPIPPPTDAEPVTAGGARRFFLERGMGLCVLAGLGLSVRAYRSKSRAPRLTTRGSRVAETASGREA